MTAKLKSEKQAIPTNRKQGLMSPNLEKLISGKTEKVNFDLTFQILLDILDDSSRGFATIVESGLVPKFPNRIKNSLNYKKSTTRRGRKFKKENKRTIKRKT